MGTCVCLEDFELQTSYCFATQYCKHSGPLTYSNLWNGQIILLHAPICVSSVFVCTELSLVFN